MAVLTPDLFWLQAEEILDCVCNALYESADCGCPCRTYVSVGQPAWDDCCEGQLTVWIENTYFHDTFPIRKTDAVICSTPIAADLVVQLLRCAPTVGDDGSLPSGPVLTESSRRIYQDMYITQNALACCLSERKRDRLYTIRDAKPVGPQGGCAGFEIRISIQMIDPLPGTE